MVHQYNGEYELTKTVVEDWKSTVIGVYYVGTKSMTGGFADIKYVGRATGEGGVRTRLLEHLNSGKWPSNLIFGYKVCDTIKDAKDHETAEIQRLQPAWNKVGKTA